MKITPREKRRHAAGREKNQSAVKGQKLGLCLWSLIFLSPLRVSPFLAWGDFHARSRFARSTIPEEKWGTTRSLAAVEMAIQRAVETDEVLLHTYSFLSLCVNDDLPLKTVLKFVKAQVKGHPEVLMKAKIVRSSLSLVHSEEAGKPTYLRLYKVVHDALKRGEIANLKSCRESDHTMAEAVKIFNSQLKENDENCAFCKKLRPHCESLLKQMTSE